MALSRRHARKLAWLVWQSPEALPFGKHSGVYTHENLQAHIISQSNSWRSTERKSNRIHTLTGIPTMEQSLNTAPGSKGKRSMAKQPQTKFISSYVKQQKNPWISWCVGLCLPKRGERKTNRRKERRKEWRKKGDQDRPLGNHWCKRQRALTFGLKDLGFIRKIKSIL